MSFGREFDFFPAVGNPRKISLFYRKTADQPIGLLHWCTEGSSPVALYRMRFRPAPCILPALCPVVLACAGKRTEVKAQSLALRDVSDVYVGKQTLGFTREVAAHAPSQCCFSLVTPRWTLNLEAPSEKQRDVWVQGITGILQAWGHSCNLHKVGATPCHSLRLHLVSILTSSIGLLFCR